MKTKNQYVSENEMGIGGTNSWYMGGVDKNKSIAFYFDVTNNAAN